MVEAKSAPAKPPRLCWAVGGGEAHGVEAPAAALGIRGGEDHGVEAPAAARGVEGVKSHGIEALVGGGWARVVWEASACWRRACVRGSMRGMTHPPSSSSVGRRSKAP
jgi:hypothetical protein